ncbi:MAG: OpgC protein [Acidobacteriaceae bacterium]|jgi:hypothetical protein|nr:OpgC protein [Acidobacteriaceae bacterium]
MTTRRLELDAARGLMLVWITLTHLPTKVSAYVYQPFGFVSAAEGFIFLSALFTGLIYFRVAEKDGYAAMHRKLRMRTLKLYGYHFVLLAITFLVVAKVAATGSRPRLLNLLDFYFAAGPRRAVIDAALLIYRPPLLDILPMYIMFLLFTPFLLSAAERFGWKLMLSGSFTLWLLAQFGLRQAVYSFSNRFLGLRIPVNEMGSFDLWAWQFVWVLGIWLGVRWAKGNLPLESWAKRVTIPAAIVFVTFLVMRYTVASKVGNFEPLFDKWHLGPIRAINFAAVAALLIRFQSVAKPLAIRPFVMMGQASLQVFCVHLLFCFGGLALVGKNTSEVLGIAPGVAWLAVSLSALLLTGHLFSRKEKPKRKSLVLSKA